MYVGTIATTDRLSDAMCEINRPSLDKPQNSTRNQTKVRSNAGNISRKALQRKNDAKHDVGLVIFRNLQLSVFIYLNVHSIIPIVTFKFCKI